MGIPFGECYLKIVYIRKGITMSNEYKIQSEKMNVTERIKRLEILKTLIKDATAEKTAIENSLIERFKVSPGDVVTMSGKGTKLKLEWNNIITSVDVNKLKADGIYDNYTKESYRKKWSII